MVRKSKTYTYGHTDEEIDFFCDPLDDKEVARADLDSEQITMIEKFVREKLVERHKEENGRVYYTVDAEGFYKGTNDDLEPMQMDLRESNRS